MEKKDLTQLTNQLKALDNETKLEIIKYLALEGSKSVTDISKALNINFSTAHKYLEQLERAKLVTSKQVLEDRLKRLFSVNNFKIDLSPAILTEQSTKSQKNIANPGFTIMNVEGEVVKFDSQRFIEACLSASIPLPVIQEGMHYLKEISYNNISTLELEQKFSEFLINKNNQIISAARTFGEKGIFKEGTFINYLKKTEERRLISRIINGEIYVRNIGQPKMLNFSHDLQALSNYGIEKIPETFEEFLEELMILFKRSKDLIHKSFALDSFNLFISPYTQKMSDQEILNALDNFFKKLSKRGNKLHIGIDLGSPKFIKHVNVITQLMSTVDYVESKEINYENYIKEANRIAKLLTSYFINFESINLLPVLKFWPDWNKLHSTLKLKRGFRLVNMIPNWQTVNATYVSNTRYDARWKYWFRCVRVGEIQEVCINLPHLALISKSEEEYYTNLKELLSDVSRLIVLSSKWMAENITDLGALSKKEVKRARYMHFDDSLYTISLSGTREASELLATNNPQNQLTIIENTIQLCNDIASRLTKTIVRTDVKSNNVKSFSDKFFQIDKTLYNTPLKKYSVGVSSSQDPLGLSYHRHLLGGHETLLSLNKIDLTELLKKDWGLIKVG